MLSKGNGFEGSNFGIEFQNLLRISNKYMNYDMTSNFLNILITVVTSIKIENNCCYFNLIF